MTALIRTIVPLFWGYLLTQLSGIGVPVEVIDVLTSWSTYITGGVLLVATAAVYQAAQWLIKQSWFPNWIAVLFAGSIRQPTYPTLRQ